MSEFEMSNSCREKAALVFMEMFKVECFRILVVARDFIHYPRTNFSFKYEGWGLSQYNYFLNFVYLLKYYLYHY